ncbi:hypothetical protein K525DRAFT_290434 [Schizophyllum commune Loenen D]|nr:hypothetical protein K525DRAFT_290434 [Schizophyllum commune Loenen D]
MATITREPAQCDTYPRQSSMPPEICRRVLIRRRKNNIARVPLLSPYNKAIFAKTLRLQQTAHMFVDVATIIPRSAAPTPDPSSTRNALVRSRTQAPAAQLGTPGTKGSRLCPLTSAKGVYLLILTS